MPTPATRTPVRIARGSYSNLNGSVSDLQDGEISYAEDQDKLYIKEGGSLVALTYTPASPAFTGTITGVNLTLSGNLTVNGTQTIINTQTLDVEDKQIEIGKVSSPSDTTADQGGIILKGASDKSILWYNSTDSWTFNQGIVINGNATFTGTGTAIDNAIDILYNHSSGVGQINVDSSGGNTSLKLGTSNSGSITTALTIDSSQNATFAGVVTLQDTAHEKLKIIAPSGEGSDWAYMGFYGTDAARNAYIGVNATGDVKISRDGGSNIELGTDATLSAKILDSKGDLRKIPQQNEQGSAHTLVAADSGKHILADATVTVPPTSGIFSAGDAITIINNGGSDISIARGSGVTMHNAADGSNADRTLGTKGMATILCGGSNTYYISGAGLS